MTRNAAGEFTWDAQDERYIQPHAWTGNAQLAELRRASVRIVRACGYAGPITAEPVARAPGIATFWGVVVDTARARRCTVTALVDELIVIPSKSSQAVT